MKLQTSLILTVLSAVTVRALPLHSQTKENGMSYPLHNGRIPHIHGDVAIRSDRPLPVAEDPEAYELGSGRRNPKAGEFGVGRKPPRVGSHRATQPRQRLPLPVSEDPEAYELGSGRRNPKASEHPGGRGSQRPVI
ncbi:MAG: hypothetical protein J3Q66DRAFT_434877 [Benniella sp.]|nr:MAG: hypothetical protein J3Q66DRAFT_434877 [Benniella sp.]